MDFSNPAINKFLSSSINSIANNQVAAIAGPTTQSSQDYITSSEWMSKMLYNDSIVALSSVLRLLMVSLVTPENLITTLDETTEDDDMNKYEKIKALTVFVVC